MGGQAVPSGSRVLVIDDCRLSRALAERALTKAGYTVYAADSGIAAVEALVGAARHRRAAEVELPKFDLLIIDVNMPELSGPDAVRVIRARGGRMPIIACSGSDLEKDREECLRAGCDAYVVKPFRPEALVEACRSVVTRAA